MGESPKLPANVDITANGCMERLQHAIQALALPPDKQIALFPDFVIITDELALDFDNWWHCIQDDRAISLSHEQLAALNALDAKLSSMSASTQSALWTEAALRTDLVWQEVRELAQDTLRVFGWPNEQPQLYASEYVKGKRF